jgi:RNA polymerase sigma-70 factor (ECF subfamily)
MAQHPGDEELIQSILDGETHRYAELVDRYKNLGFSLAMCILHQKEDAEEALQDSFLKAYRYLSSFRKESGFQTWFYKIVYRTCLSRLSVKKIPMRGLEEGDEEDLNRLNGQPLFDDELAEKNLVQFIQKFSDQLPENYRILYTLFYQNEQTYEEICKITGLPLATVKIRLHRLRTMLKEKVSKALAKEESVV